ncbi:MAG TPA: ATP-binding protein [Polyangiaceae bacterium]|jgi:signal transduction histidine kinase|nr:ATP-binding protein [Polyangiaceae bacterium]
MDAAVAFVHPVRAQGGPRERRVKTYTLMAWMLLAIAAVAAVAYWDEQREFDSALKDFAGEQTALAQAVGTTLRERLTGVGVESASGLGTLSEVQLRLRLALATEQFLLAAHSVERPQSVRLFVQGPLEIGLLASDGRAFRSAALEMGLASDAPSARLSRQEAASLGLPARTAMAGFSRIDAAGAGRWGVAVVASARRERDREVFAEWRLALSVFVASSLVLAFGGLALRNQRRQMLLAQELAIASVQSERDERLVRADKLATMGALATGIAHEVSTPLGVILGRAEQLLAKLNGDERSKRAAEAIAEQAERISAIVRGFLALARGDSPRTERIAPRALAEAALELVGHRFEKAGVELSHFFGQDLPEISCEPRLMEQVLVNLLLNACDACKAGGHVELRVVAEEDRLAFVVLDDGGGISADAAARIMDPFFTTKPLGEGSGLGLAIANELVKHHRGTLTVAAREGHAGTRASVELPTASETADG